MAGDDRTEEIRLLQDIARWTRELALPLVRPRVERLLDSDAKKRVYAATAEGDASVKSIESTSGANHRDVREWIKSWEAEGIVDKDSSPPKATFKLSELGIAAAPPKASRKAAAK